MLKILGNLKIINFPFGTNGGFIILGVPVLILQCGIELITTGQKQPISRFVRIQEMKILIDCFNPIALRTTKTP